MLRILAALALVIALPAVSAKGAVFLTGENMSGSTDNIRYDAGASAPEGGKAYAAFGQGATTYTTFFDYAVGEDLAPGAVQAVAYLSCDVPTIYRPASPDRPTATVNLLKGETQVASASLESTRTCDGPDDVWEAAFDLDATSATYAPGDTMTLEFLVWWATPPPGEGQNGHFLVGGEQASGLYGPGLPGDPALASPASETVHGTFDGAIDHDFSNATDASYVLNTTVDGPQDMHLAVAPESGSVAVRVRGEQGELFNATYDEPEELNATLDGATGAWSVEIGYAAYTGSLRLSFAAPPPEPSGNTTTTETGGPGGNTTDDGSGNETAGGEESPALPVVAVIVVVVAFVVRRRP